MFVRVGLTIPFVFPTRDGGLPKSPRYREFIPCHYCAHLAAPPTTTRVAAEGRELRAAKLPRVLCCFGALHDGARCRCATPPAQPAEYVPLGKVMLRIPDAPLPRPGARRSVGFETPRCMSHRYRGSVVLPRTTFPHPLADVLSSRARVLVERHGYAGSSRPRVSRAVGVVHSSWHRAYVTSAHGKVLSASGLRQTASGSGRAT